MRKAALEDTRGGCRSEKLHYHDLPVSWTCGNSGNIGNSGDSIKIWGRQWEKRRENCKVWIHQRDPEGNFCICVLFGPLMQLWLGHSTLHLHLSNVHCSMFIYFFIHQHHPPVFKGWALQGNVFPLSIEVLKNWVICVIIWSCMNSEDEQCEACFSPELKRFCLIAGAPASRSWVIVQYLKLSNWQQRSD